MTIEDYMNTLKDDIKNKFHSIDVSGSKSKGIYDVYFIFKELLKAEDAVLFYHSAYDFIKDNLKAQFELNISYNFDLDYQNIDMTEYFDKLLSDLISDKPRLMIIKRLQVDFTGKEFIINAPAGGGNFNLYAKEIEKKFNKFGFDLSVNILEKEFSQEEISEVIDEAPKAQPVKQEAEKKVFVKNNKNFKIYEVEPISKIPSDQLGLSDYQYTNGPTVFKVRGEIFSMPDPNPRKIESKKFKGGAAYIFHFLFMMVQIQYVLQNSVLKKMKLKI